MGGTHGDERATVPLAQSFAERWLAAGLLDTPVAVLPCLNPDGFAANSRYNGRGVDLNRNFERDWTPLSGEPSGPSSLSEPETLALRGFLDRFRPSKIVSLHWALGEIDPDGAHSKDLARRMWDALTPRQRRPYRLRRPGNTDVTAEIECPGSLGRLCGFGLVYPSGRRPAMVTLELPHEPFGPRPEKLPEDHLRRVESNWRASASAYLHGVREGVHRMLLEAVAFRPGYTGASGREAR